MTNKASDTSTAINWVAHKAAIWGKLIKISARAKHSREQTIKQLEGNLDKRMEEQHRTLQIDMRPKIDEARLALTLSLTTQA